MAHSDPASQMVKTIEEKGELAMAIAKNNLELAKDAIGDIFVTITLQAALNDVDLEAVTDKALQDEHWLDRNAWLTHCDVKRIFLELDAMSGELSRAVNALDGPYIGKWIADIVLALYVLSDKLDLILDDCIAHALEVIEARKGKMIGGVFVKEEDLAEAVA